MNETIKLLKEYEEIADLHADRLQMALEHLKTLFPLTKAKMKNFSDEQLGYLEILTTRFSKLQDLIGGKIFTLILSSVEENVEKLTMLDKLNLLEKKEFLESVKKWQLLRELRNDIAHDYPNQLEELVEDINKIAIEAKWLLDYWQQLKGQMQKRVYK